MKLTIVTTMRNEGAHALEWIAHHRAAGVSDFLIYLNDCEDGTEALLCLLPGVHVVVQGAGDKPPQWRALKAAWEHPAVQAADWLACIDCDEFLNLNRNLADIPQLIEEVGGDAILLPWRLFGHNGKVSISDAPTTERFTRAAPADILYPATATYFKTLFRREGPFRKLGVHRPKQKNPDNHGLPAMHDGSGQPIPVAMAANDTQIMNWGEPIARDLVQLNHYSLRSAAEFMLKRYRGLPNHTDKPVGLDYWVERNFNTVVDDTIAHMRAATAAVEAEFLAIPGVAKARQVCRDWQQTRFAELMRDREELKLYGKLLLSEGSAALPEPLARDLVKAYGRAHG